MARAKSASLTPPSPESILAALAMLKEKWEAYIATIPNVVPGSQAYIDIAQRWLANEVRNAEFLTRLSAELAQVWSLAQGEKGPVTPDPVDLS